MLKLVLFLCISCAGVFGQPQALKMDTSEAEAVLAILDKQSRHVSVTDADWKRLFGSEPYVRLKKREAAMRREFTDDDFRRFVLSPELLARREALASTLARWKQADLEGAAERVKRYLPAGAQVHAKVYPVIKPKQNSFVFEVDTDPAVFLYLDPEQSASDFANTVAHESHHIGLAYSQKKYDEVIEAATEPKRAVLNWAGGFGEGLAVLAAAGGPDVHPMEAFSPADRARWDQDMKFWKDQFSQVDTFFKDVLRGGYKDRETIDHVGFTFFGYRGPWYVVGYKMAVVVEKQFGREALLGCIADPRKLMLRYNEAAKKMNETAVERLPLWSDEVIAAMK